MKNINFNLKSIVQSKARWLLTILALLTLGVGQMWGTNYLYMSTTDGSSGSRIATFDGSNNAIWTSTRSTTTYFYGWDGSKAYLNGDRAFTSPNTEYDVWKYTDANYFHTKTMTPVLNGVYRFSFWQKNGDNYVLKYQPYIIVGNGSGNWLGGNAWQHTQINNIAKTSVTYSSCAAGQKIFRITPYGEWDQSHGYLQVTSCNVPYYTNEDNNIVFYTAATADITIGFNGTNITISVSYNSTNLNALKKDILNNDKIMFYYGDEYGISDNKYVNTNGTTTHVCTENKGFKFVQTQIKYLAVAAVAPVEYSISNSDTWSGVAMSATAQAGAIYTCYNDGSNKMRKVNGVAPTWSTSTATVKVGTAASGISATCSNSALERSQTISYYYTQNSGTTWTEFTPTNVSGLAAGVYKVRALAYDGNIYVRTATEGTLTIENTYTVTVNNDGHGTTSPSGAQSNVGEVSGLNISIASGASGYEFASWSITSGSGTFEGGGTSSTTASTKFYPTDDATIQANFRSTATNTLTVIATAGGSITTPAAGYYSDITTTGYTITASRSEGYKFTGWSQTAGAGAVSIANSSALSTTATITTLGDVTVTAGFAAMSNSLSVSPGTLYAGDNITLTATKTNHTLDLTYQYKIGEGAWTDIATQSGTSKTWQIPYANTYQTYKFRVKSTDGSTDIISPEQTVIVKGRIIIHVKNTNSWGSMYLYSWYSEDTKTNGNWPGKNTTDECSNEQAIAIHETGSLWYDVTITQTTSNAAKFILNCNTTGDKNKTQNLNLSDFTHDAYYAMSTNASSAQTLSSTSTPTAPTVSTLAVGTIRETSAVLGGNIAALGNDIISERGYYWSTDPSLSSSNLGENKVVVSGTQNATGNFSNTKSELTAGTTYYFIAYAKNGYGIGYSPVQNFTTLGTYTVTVDTESASKGTVSPISVTAGQYSSSATFTAAPTDNYVFKEWTKSTDNITIANPTSASTTLTATSAGTVTATFADKWNLKGDQWGSWTYMPLTATGNANEFSTTLALTKGQKYQFKVIQRGISNDTWYGNTDGAGNKVFERGGSSFSTEANGMNNNLEVTPDVTGSYTFTINTSASTPSIAVAYPTAYTVTFNAETFVNGDASHSASTTGGTVSAVDDHSAALGSGEYVLTSTGTATITAAKKTGYTFGGFFDNAACSGGQYTNGVGGATISGEDNEVLTLASLTGNKTVYAKFTENMTTVTLAHTGNGHVEIGGETVTSTTAGKTTTRTITAVPDAGYYFAGWTVSDGADCSVASTAGRNDNESSSTTLSGLGAGTTGTVTANFVENDKIYFKNWNDDNDVALWSNVYVYFGVSWPGDYDNSTKANSNSSYRVQMTQVGSTNVYEAYVPRSFTASGGANVAFANYACEPNNHFYQNEGAMWGSYNRKLNMYVPKYSDTESRNSTKYYKGYWKNYGLAPGAEAGYYMKRLNSSSNGYEDASTDCKFVVVNENTISYTLRVDNMGTDYHNKYMVHSAGAIKYVTHNVASSEGTAITSAACTDVTMTQYDDGTPRFLITPTSEGDYVITIDQSGDVMKISVNYPVAVGDYQLIHTYTDGSAKSSHSDIIKGGTASTTVSMYLDMDAATKSLTLKKCTGTAGGTPTWSTGNTVASFNTTTFDKGNGVYKFDITIADDAVSAITNAAPYTGNYYIKTDYAPGGWANYTENVLSQNTINFSKSDSKTFDYYHCAWVGDGDKNVKCIIANDYNQQLTDTLIGDDVLGTDGGNPRQYLATAANVRFSYNSYTNELRRAYINGASGWEASFLSLKDMHSGDGTGDATITKTSGTTLTNDTISFLDKGNWIYQISVKAKEYAYIYLSANYRFSGNDHQQDLIGTSSTGALLIGDGLGDTPEPITIIYDFKTNNLIAAWTPAEQAYGTEIDLNSDVLLIHNRKSDGTDAISKIDLTGSGKIKTIDRVYSAFRFQKTTADGIIGLSGSYSSTEESYYRYNYWISFPYDVKMTDIFGLPDYGSKWRIQYYDGAERASKGFYRGDGTTTFWKTMSMNDDATLKKGEGYVLQLSPSAFKATGSGSLWALVDELYLYFPSKAEFGNIALATSSITFDPYTCTTGAFTDGQNKTHDITDSHWHVFGIPTFNDATGTTGTGHDYYDSADADDQAEDHDITDAPFYFSVYTNDGTTCDTYTPTSSSGFTFQPMHAYMIQMHGTLNFTTNSVPASVAARRSGTPENYTVRLELAADGVEQDRTFVTLRDEAAADFALNEDMMKIHNSGRANIYSYAGAYDVASNILPVESRTVTLGVEVAADGTYTFRMPADISGTVTLLDNQTNTRTNLSAGDYEVYLAKGTYEGRFFLEIDVREVTTVLPSYDGYSDSDHVLKFVRDGHLFIRRQTDTFDARGNRVR